MKAKMVAIAAIITAIDMPMVEESGMLHLASADTVPVKKHKNSIDKLKTTIICLLKRISIPSSFASQLQIIKYEAT